MTCVRLGVLITIILSTMGALAAEDPPRLQEEAAAITRLAGKAVGEMVAIRHLSRALGIPIEAIQMHQEQTRLGLGELLLAHRITRLAGLSKEEVVDEFRNGKAWSAIATEYHVDLGDLEKQMRASREEIEGEADRVRTGVSPPEMKKNAAGKGQAKDLTSKPRGSRPYGSASGSPRGGRGR